MEIKALIIISLRLQLNNPSVIFILMRLPII